MCVNNVTLSKQNATHSQLNHNEDMNGTMLMWRLSAPDGSDTTIARIIIKKNPQPFPPQRHRMLYYAQSTNAHTASIKHMPARIEQQTGGCCLPTYIITSEQAHSILILWRILCVEVGKVECEIY